MYRLQFKVQHDIKYSRKTMLSTKYSLKHRYINLRIIIFFCTVLLMSLFIYSCKTCKCPAYSQIEIQKSENIANSRT